MGRLIKAHGANEAEFAVLITDRFQGKGLGTELLRQLLGFARAERLQRLYGDILVETDCEGSALQWKAVRGFPHRRILLLTITLLQEYRRYIMTRTFTQPLRDEHQELRPAQP